MTTIQNNRLSVTVRDLGAELQSVKLDGTERLWQGDASVWEDRSPVLFPFVGCIKNGIYTYQGKEYPATSHGFAAATVFSLVDQTETSLTYRIVSTEETKKIYPFDFIFDVTYSLDENKLTQTFTVTNTGDDKMYYAYGAHPGFFAPPAEGTEFSDRYLQFAEGQPLNQMILDGMFMSKDVVPCPFARGNKIPLTHETFRDDALIFEGLQNKVFEIKSDKSPHRILCDCTDFDYLALWSETCDKANYVCIEPWNGLPSDSKADEDLTVKRDMRILLPGQSETGSVSYLLD
ncbi:MAG: aldose 1-epimerase family protein [Clostridia bacterium]|nr:aldose 1-epimerase family protein [Clostridia bacterium]